MSDVNLEQRSGCGPRLVWLAKTVFAFLIVIGVIVAIVWGGFMIYQMVQNEIDRSSNSVATRFDAQESRIDILRQEVNTLVTANPGQEEQLAQLQQQLTAVQTQLTDLDTDLSQQNNLLATLEAAMTTTLSNDETAANNIVALNDGLTALQGDLNSTGVRIDSLGGELDGLMGDVGDLSGKVLAASETAVTAQEQATVSETAVDDMAQTLMIFRAWELIARARLRLLENNIGLAQTDVAKADEMLQQIILVLPEDADETDAFQTVQMRLALAADNLALDPAIAGADLETAWDELDKILAARLQPVMDELELGTDLETPVPQEAETTPSPEPTATATQEAAPTPEPSPTPSS